MTNDQKKSGKPLIKGNVVLFPKVRMSENGIMDITSICETLAELDRAGLINWPESQEEAAAAAYD